MKVTKRKLQNAINTYLKCAIADSWKGGGDPLDWEEIKTRLHKSKRKLNELLDELFSEMKGKKVILWTNNVNDG